MNRERQNIHTHWRVHALSLTRSEHPFKMIEVQYLLTHMNMCTLPSLVRKVKGTRLLFFFFFLWFTLAAVTV